MSNPDQREIMSRDNVADVCLTRRLQDYELDAVAGGGWDWNRPKEIVVVSSTGW